MEDSEFRRARAAAMSVVASLGLPADDAIVLHDSNKLTLRLLPCDLVARVAPASHGGARFEVGLARQLRAAGCPVAALDPRVEPRVYERDGFDITLWTYYGSVTSGEIPAADYADALERLHAGMRRVDAAAPHFLQRVDQARRLVADRDRTPALVDADRDLLADALRRYGQRVADGGRPEQLLHGEPHPGNLLATAGGPLLIDLETCCRGPVEFDLAHAPEHVAARYPGTDPQVLRDCRMLMLAIITTWRWDRDDQLPDGSRLGAEWLALIRDAR